MLRAAGLAPIAGADEAGRGACAGPLVAAAVILDPDRPIDGLDDSKALTEKARERLYPVILERAAASACVSIPAPDVDRMGVQRANLFALQTAVESLDLSPTFVITDGFAVEGLGMASVGMWKADQVASCVSAASIIAKVTRDRYMTELDQIYPDYEFSVHKGYATALHQRHLDELGPCAEHRLSYANVARTTRVVSS
ncbi:MAG: ribonuclease HII [Propionibacteriaceae bacterium]|jgi:ribonuclease HII|nr:ribonuclease HII [Propionibacteriaceae bacterium]